MPGLFCRACRSVHSPSPVRFLLYSLPDNLHQECSIIVRGRPPMGTRILLMLLCLGILNTVMACAVAPPPAVTPPPVALPAVTPPPAAPSAVAPPATPPPADVPLPYRPPPSTTGNRAPDLYHPSPYEHKMEEEEQQYRQQRGVQERAQEQRYRQWEQERARERDPRYEWMR